MRIETMTFGKRGGSKDPAIFDGINLYTITQYQRPYVWEPTQAKGVIQDISYILNNSNQKRDVVWPSVLLQKSAILSNGRRSDSHYLVGDGQQRITTIFLALIAIWQAAQPAFIQDPSLRNEKHGRLIDNLFPQVLSPMRDSGLLAGVAIGSSKAESFLTFRDSKLNKIFDNFLVDYRSDKGKKIKEFLDKDKGALNRVYVFLRNHFAGKPIENLHQSAEALLYYVKMPVVIYEEGEDMLRAFSNMNSIGIALTTAEMLKAAIYAKAIEVDSSGEIADKFAIFWHERLEGDLWSSFNKNDGEESTAYNFVEQYYHYKTKWNRSIVKGKAHRDSAYWLRDWWVEDILSNIHSSEDFEIFLKDFKTKSRLYEIWLLKAEEPNKKDINWDFAFVRDVLSVPMIDSALFTINDLFDSNESKRAVLILLLKYLSTVLLTLPGRAKLGIVNMFIAAGSPMLNEKGNVNPSEFEQWIVDTSRNNKSDATWLPNNSFQKKLLEMSYSKAAATELATVFVIYANIQSMISSKRDELSNPKYRETNHKKSIEHILPQRPREELDEHQQIVYDSLVGKLGNLTVISVADNKELSNKNPGQKMKTYEEERVSTRWGAIFMPEILDVYRKNKTRWSQDEINSRTTRLASKFAEAFCQPANYTVFEELSKPETKEIKRGKYEVLIGDETDTYVEGSGISVTWLKYIEEKLSEPEANSLILKDAATHKRLFVLNSDSDNSKKYGKIIDEDDSLKVRIPTSRDNLDELVQQLSEIIDLDIFVISE